ncbi:hypothetical protein C8R47DRAFT_558740 [Mycena vitilis]|nr:hypothetical protein C8R47DRAFT_558740 [Mycena vitilis]
MFSKISKIALLAIATVRAQLDGQLPLSSILKEVPAQAATVFSLVYGTPLTQYVIFGNSIANKSGGEWMTNELLHETTLANASYHTIVLPNVDTLYSEALIDLSISDVVATMPPLEPGRYYIWPFYDVYGNNFCNIGTTAKSRPGKYLITYAPANPGCPPPSADIDGEYFGEIRMPTPYGASLLRIQVDNSSDIDHVVTSVQGNFTLSTVPISRPQLAPPLTRSLLNDGFDTTDSATYLMQLTARLSIWNFPEDGADIARVTSILRMAGISRGSYTTPSGVDLTLALSTARSKIAAVKTKFLSLGNGWASLPPNLSANFRSHYVVRAFVALKGYMEVSSNNALYPTYAIDGYLYSNQSYIVTFTGKPEVSGFWSLTMYDGAGYLVPNNSSVYSLSDRDNITYPDGTLVSSTPPNSKAPFYMLLQSTDYEVSPEWQSNWLPTPADGAQFKFIFRLYGPKKALYGYTYPLVTPVEVNPPIPTETVV